MKNAKLWSILCLGLVLALLLAAAGLTAAVDPFFHYHAPVDSLSYPLTSQRYQNDGIVRHFDYDALITGTSMAENFKTSELDALFGTHSVKVCYSGGTFPELTANLRQALEANPELRLVLLSIDEWFLFAGRDMILASGAYPTYLYDDNPFNDVQYLLNKDVLCTNTLGVLAHTAAGEATTSFDDFGSWVFPYDREVVLGNYSRPEITGEAAVFTPQERENITRNLREQLLSLAQEYPDTEFLFFFPPYSILNWDAHTRESSVDRYVDAFQAATQLLLEAPNVRVFSFYTDFETTTNLDNYRDTVHYSNDINSLLLQRMAAGEYELTQDNYLAHWQNVRSFYSTYDYESLFS